MISIEKVYDEMLALYNHTDDSVLGNNQSAMDFRCVFVYVCYRYEYKTEAISKFVKDKFNLYSRYVYYAKNKVLNTPFLLLMAKEVKLHIDRIMTEQGLFNKIYETEGEHSFSLKPNSITIYFSNENEIYLHESNPIFNGKFENVLMSPLFDIGKFIDDLYLLLTPIQ